jgi:hypothetical protein
MILWWGPDEYLMFVFCLEMLSSHTGRRSASSRIFPGINQRVSKMILKSRLWILLSIKVPKYEIFDRSDFRTLGLKYKLATEIFWGARLHSISDAHADRTHQFLRLPLTDAHAQCTHQFLTRTLSAGISSLRACSACFEGTFSNLDCLRWGWALSIHVRNWCVCSGYATDLDAFAQRMH